MKYYCSSRAINSVWNKIWYLVQLYWIMDLFMYGKPAENLGICHLCWKRPNQPMPSSYFHTQVLYSHSLKTHTARILFRLLLYLFIHLAILSIKKDQKELCIWFEKKYYFWNEVSLRLKAFKIKWSIEQHFRQFPASKYLLQIYNLPLFEMMKIELFICPLLKIRYIYASLHC